MEFSKKTLIYPLRLRYRFLQELSEHLLLVRIKGNKDEVFKDIHKELVLDYIKIHKDGNPQYTIDQFDDPDFIACPAFYRDGTAWERYMAQATPEEMQKLKSQIILIDHKLGMHI